MDINQLILQQKNNMNNERKDVNVIEKENDLQKFLWKLSLEEWYSLIWTSLKWKTILIICAWSWYDADFRHKKWAKVTATDLSEMACRKIKERNPNIDVQVENAEQLSYSNNSFDYVIVRAWLHHLPRPILGIYEMLRVAKVWILFMEAQDSRVMRLLRKSWLVCQIEPSWNFVYSFTRREIQKLCGSMFLPRPKIKTYFYQYIPFLNNKIYTKLSGKLPLIIYKFILSVVNIFIWRRWNNFICYIPKHTKNNLL